MGDFMKKKLFLLLLLVILVFIIFNFQSISRIVVDYYVTQLQESKHYPTHGTYECTDLQMRITFQGDNVIATYPDDTKIQIYIDFYGRFVFEDGTIAFYFWDQKDNILEIEFDHTTSNITEESTFLFEQVD